MRLAVLQFAPRFGTPADNLARIAALLDGQVFDLLVLPELCLTGYQFRDAREMSALAERPDGPHMTSLSRLLSDGDSLAVVGFAERAPEGVYNSAALLGPKGPLAVYRKLHLFGHEKEAFLPGNRPLQVVDTAFGRIGMLICFDWVFPEVSRSLALGGAQILAHPANLVLPHGQRAMVTRAIENRVFTATANRTGSEARRPGECLRFTGGSRIIAPDGAVLAQADIDEEVLLVADMDPNRADDKQITPQNHILTDRRPGFYRQ